MKKKNFINVLFFLLCLLTISLGVGEVAPISRYTLNAYCPTNVVFGSSYNGSGDAFRFFKWELSNMNLVIYE